MSDKLLLLLTNWFILSDGRITDQGGCILTHQEKNDLLDKVNSFYYAYSDEEITQANQPTQQVYNRYKEAKPQKPKSPARAGLIYLLKSENGLHKIGLTTNLKSRLISYTSSPVKISLIHSFNTDDTVGAEYELHDKFSEYRKIGEWFELSESQINEVIKIKEYKNGLFISE